MQEPTTTIYCKVNDNEFTIDVFDNVDKVTGFYYTTLQLDADNFIVLSRYDTDEWKVDGMTKDALGKLLSKIHYRLD